MFANMLASLIMHGQLVTTLPKAKDLRPLAERIITLAKRGGIYYRRLVASRVRHPEAVKRLFDIIAPSCSERKGGYLRILKAGFRVGDSAPIGIIEFVDKASLGDDQA